MKQDNDLNTLMNSFLRKFDGSDREPRALQLDAFRWLSSNWSSPALVLQCPTGTGKSAIARAIQLQTDAAILVPNNALLDQYSDSYPTLNALKGKEHYECAVGGDHDDCEDCGYAKARERSKTEPTVFNPLSFLYSDADPSVIVVDEAHKLDDFMRLLIGYRFNSLKYSPPKDANWEWVASKAAEYKSIGSIYQERGELKKAAQSFQRARSLRNISKTLKESPENFITYFEEDGTWVVEPLEVPASVYNKLFGRAKVILLSATIPPKWAKQVLGQRQFKYLDLPSPIPKENRKVLARYTGLKASSSPLEIAQWIKTQLKEFKGNAIVHTTYSMGLELAKFFPDALVHTKQTKLSTLRKFKRHGGLWIAAGASEGIDLSGDTGRVNLIPVIPFENNKTPVGEALFKKDEEEYYLKAAVALIQQAGRTTRGIDDWSVTVVGDNRMTWLLKKCEKELPKSFKEAIVWR